MNTTITWTDGDSFFLQKQGWEFLKNAIINPQGNRGTWLYQGDKTTALKLLDEKLEAISKKSAEYYSRQWV